MSVGGLLTRLGIRPYLLYRLFKYSIYALLCYNVVLWFWEDHVAAAETFGDTLHVLDLDKNMIMIRQYAPSCARKFHVLDATQQF